MKNTPKTLKESIQDGLDNPAFMGPDAEVIENHVRDFLSQRFGAAMMSDQSLVDLWQLIIKK